jgi:tetratricopeptide (TPR) repeat protein
MIGIALVIALAAITVVGVRRRSPFGLTGLWFGVCWVPHFGFVPWHEVFAERFLYLPSIGLSIGAATAGVYVWRWCAREPRAVRWQPALAWTGLAVVLLLGAATHQRNHVWQSGEALWSNAVQNHPTAAKSRKAMADYHMLHGRPDLALGHYREAVKLLPEYQDAHVGIAAALIEQRKIREAFAHLDTVIERWPDNARAHALAGLLHDSIGERDQAIAEFERAVAHNPQFGPGWVSLGTFYAEAGQMDRALEMFDRGATVESSKLDALKRIAAVHRFLGDAETADVYEARAREALGGS